MNFVFCKITYIVVADMKLAFANIAPVLPLRIMLIGLDFMGGQNPVADKISPYSHPYEYIT